MKKNKSKKLDLVTAVAVLTKGQLPGVKGGTTKWFIDGVHKEEHES